MLSKHDVLEHSERKATVLFESDERLQSTCIQLGREPDMISLVLHHDGPLVSYWHKVLRY